MDPLEEIKSRIDIVPFISEYVKLSRAGRNFKALCPFHKEKTPSFVVSPELGIWRCFGACGEGGDIFKFLMRIESIEFPEALRILADRAGVKVAGRGVGEDERERFYKINKEAGKFYHYLLTRHPLGALALSYLKKDRGLNSETIETFGLGFAPESSAGISKFFIEKQGFKKDELVRVGIMIEGKAGLIDRFKGRIIFPLRDHRGNIVGFSGRLMPTLELKEKSKYVNTPETPTYQKRRHLFGLDITKGDIKEKSLGVVVEGEFDVLSSWQTGVKNVVAIKGSSLTEEQARLLSRFTQEVVLALDRDIAGDHAARAGVFTLEREGLKVKVLDLGPFKDPDEAARADPEGLKRRVSNAPLAYDYFIDYYTARFNPSTSEGVRQLSRELSPILATIEDKILQAHYVRVLADKIGVKEEAVAAQVGRQQTTWPNVREEQTPTFTSRREILEEHLLSLSFKTNPSLLNQSNIKRLVLTPVFVRILEQLQEFLEKEKKFSGQKFIKFLPPELTDTAAGLFLTPKTEFHEGESTKREIGNICDELAALALQERISMLSEQIKTQEKTGKVNPSAAQELAGLIGKLASVKR